LDEAVSLLASHGRSAKILAGGTDLLVQRPPFVEILVDIAAMGLDGLRDDGAGGLLIGAATRVEALECTEAVTAAPFRALAEAVDVMATPTVRNMATVGGNLCNASPAADLSVALTALGAVLRVAGPKGQRGIPINEFFLGPNITALQEDEMLTEIHLPPLPEGTGSSFLKLRHHQTSVDMAIVNVATCLKVKGGLCEDAAVSMWIWGRP
jgi:aerobic carbon-monoxide dehydrogenase medium subunit